MLKDVKNIQQKKLLPTLQEKAISVRLKFICTKIYFLK